jgi:branched-chain amino acid transport system substrate-binding protein
MHLGMGSPDLVGLMKRLPEDQVPMLMPTAMVGLVWAPEGWHFSFRPTYSHEFAGLFNYMQKNLGEDRPLRIATVSTQGRAGYEDQVNGVVHLAEMYPDRFEIADQQWVDDNPVNITDQIRRMSEAEPDVVMVGATTAQVVATIRALKDLGLEIPVASSSHNGLTEVAKAVDMEDLEGSFSVFSFAPYNEEGLKAAEVYEQYHEGKGDWGIVAAQASAQTVLALRVLEAAIAEQGADGVTAPGMYEALLNNTFSSEQMLGLTPDLDFDETAPFPVGEIQAKAMVVRDGEIVPLTDDLLEVPELTKW